MARLNLNLAPIADERAKLARLERELDSGRRELAQLRSAAAMAERSGDADASRLLARRIAGEQAAQAARHRNRAETIARINATAQALVARGDPARLVASLDGELPVALFPVRIETRFRRANNGAPRSLLVRVYPDAIHAVTHVAGLGDDERAAGQAYWVARFDPAAAATADSLWRELVLRYRAPRAYYIVRALQPANVAQAGEAGASPQFPEVDAVSSLARSDYATLLPDRWCAVGYATRTTGFREVFRVWGSTISDLLPLAPQFDPDTPLSDVEKGKLFGGDRAWIVDFNAARAVGMALEVTLTDVNRRLAQLNDNRPFAWNDGLSKLVLLGVDWTLTPQQAADAVAATLDSQSASQGVQFLPLGTPTNNTGEARSGFSSQIEPATPPDNDAPAPGPGSSDALDLLVHALGIPAGALQAERFPGADIAESRLQMHALNALWRALLGNYLEWLWNPTQGNRVLTRSRLRTLRSHVVAHLRAGGPLSPLRIGKQPYGWLPVVAPSYVGSGELEATLHRLLAVLRSRWTAAAAGVPRLRGNDLDTLRQLLQTGPWTQTVRYRMMETPAAQSNTPTLTALQQAQVFARMFLISELRLAFPQLPADLLLQQCTLAATDRLLPGMPWVQADPADKNKPPRERGPDDTLEPNYIAAIEQALGDAGQAKAELSRRQSGPSLLEALLAFAAEEEFDKATTFLLEQALAPLAQAQPALTQYAGQLTELSHVAPLATSSRFVTTQNSADVARLVVPAVTGSRTLESHTAASLPAADVRLAATRGFAAAAALDGHVAARPAFIRDVSGQRQSLAFLAGRTVGELDRALKLSLDACSYRLDAWYTSLATRRLQALREQRPAGVHIGGYGWVENLRPDTRPDSLGYVHAPTLPQAATAAILRSGHLANHEAAAGALNIDLSSARTKRALDLLDGVAQGQPPAALLGYRFERALRDAPAGALARYILPFRMKYPLRPAGDNASQEAQEAIAARDVVDGYRLAAECRDHGAASALAGIALAQPAHGGQIAAILGDLVDIWDAVNDVVQAESLYQLVQGNLERSGAITGVLENQARATEPVVTKSTRTGVSYAQRVAVLCAAAQRPAAWSDIGANDPRARAEPQLDAWLARQLGDPERYRFAARFGTDANEDGALDTFGPTLTATLADLHLPAIALVLGSRTLPSEPHRDDPGRSRLDAGSLLRASLARAFEAQAAADGAVLLVEPDAPDADHLGFAVLEAVLGTLRELVERVRPAARTDLVVPIDDIERAAAPQGAFPGVDLADLQARAATAVGDLDASIAQLGAAADEDGARIALWVATPFSAAEGLPGGDDLARVQRVLAELRRRRDRCDLLAQQTADRIAAEAAKPPGSPTVPEHALRAGLAVDQVKQVFGKEFPVLPRFTLGDYAAEVGASLAARGQLLAGDERAVHGWLPKLARVRPDLDRLNAVLAAHEALAADDQASDLQVVQLPHRAQGVWAALPAAWKDRDHKAALPQLALVLHAPAIGAIDAATPVAGFMVDEWQESVPFATQITGLSFHYDAPAARAPQSVLLAVPPRVAMENWTFDELLGTVNEALDLARLRAVRPSDLSHGLGAILPANFLPQNATPDVPAVNLWQMATEMAASYKGTLVLGKL